MRIHTHTLLKLPNVCIVLVFCNTSNVEYCSKTLPSGSTGTGFTPINGMNKMVKTTAAKLAAQFSTVSAWLGKALNTSHLDVAVGHVPSWHHELQRFVESVVHLATRDEAKNMSVSSLRTSFTTTAASF